MPILFIIIIFVADNGIYNIHTAGFKVTDLQKETAWFIGPELHSVNL